MKMSTELLPLEGATSKVLEHFGFPAKDGKILEPDKKKRSVAHCKLCGKRVKFCGNTTNLRVHLRDTHTKVYSDLLQAEKERQLVLRYAGNDSSQPLLKYISVAKYSPKRRRNGINSRTLCAILSLETCNHLILSMTQGSSIFCVNLNLATSHQIVRPLLAITCQAC